ncbi:penicillin-binding protein 1C [Sulfurisoma sediminicola]|uniref:peptidoglycan glycosyltransferase n=1 Tax=Sulfurisoma sediminicola TaxID=1381557 RepID=A0A497X901_9PROT|nr:penicillin-binding protein 1C [Sulfurisoma sediminicola]RLJ62679.1 penicillin-binding protein 1C [Sulfurisoma sediminicola]
MMRRALATIALATLTVAPGPSFALPSHAEVKAAYVSSEATLLARDGRPLQSLRVDPTVRRFAWTPLHEISPALLRAVVLSEDKRFFEHGGVDWQAAGSAAWSNLGGERVRGASTLSMQLAGLIDEDARRRGRRSLFEKVTQASVALRLDGQWSKRQILETYLNLAAFRGELQGVGAMSRTLFGKWPDGLDEREAALAAALLRAPNAPASKVAQRACAILKEMQRPGECAGLDGYAASTLAGALRQGAETPALAPHLARRLLNRPGQTVRSTLDAELQRFAGEALHRHLSALAQQNAEDGAVVAIDNASGELLAWIGSSGTLSEAAEVDGVTALRQAGSTLKPFLYALAFERRNLTPASLIEDAPLTLDTGNGLYAPQNYEPQYRGWISARSALGGSLNVPAVKTLVRIGPEPFRQRLRLAGLDSLNENGDWYGYSLALGSADVSLLMLANAYRTLANGGRWSPLRASQNPADAAPCRDSGCTGVFAGKGRKAFSDQAAFIVADILADRNARAATFGLESWLATPYWAAVKTGTSKDMRDNWCIGYSRRYTVAVWVGNASGQAMHDVSGVSGAAPVWREVMDWLHRGDAASGRPSVGSPPPLPPPGIVRTALSFEPSQEPPRQEWFVAGTETKRVRGAAARALARISYPAEGTVIALDPDIPPMRQRLPLRLSSPAQKGWQWQLDERRLGGAGGVVLWLPQPGRHRLALLDVGGRELDAISFEVRALRGNRQRR